MCWIVAVGRVRIHLHLCVRAHQTALSCGAARMQDNAAAAEERRRRVVGRHLYHGISVSSTEMLEVLQAETASLFVYILSASPAESASTDAHHGITPLVLVHPHLTRGALLHAFFGRHRSKLFLVCIPARR